MRTGGRIGEAALVAALAFALAGCAATAGPGTTDAQGAGGPGSIGSSGAGVPAGPCAIQQPPGPADAPPAGAETDTTGQGPGRWRICIQTPTTIAVEASAWCRWNDERTSVVDVSGLPTAVGGIDYDTFLPFSSGKLEVHLTDRAHGGLIANYEPRQPVAPTTDSTHKAGTVPIGVALVVDPESGPPPGAPPTVAGALTWKCGEPPPG